MSEQQVRILRKLRAPLITNIIYQTIANSLISRDIISERHKSHIESDCDSFRRVKILLEVLQRRSGRDFEEFISCLEECGHRDYAEMFRTGGKFCVLLK